MATTRETLTGTMQPTSSAEKTEATRRTFLAVMLTVTLAASFHLSWLLGQYAAHLIVGL